MTDEKIFAWQTAGIWQGIPVESERYRMGNEIGGACDHGHLNILERN